MKPSHFLLACLAILSLGPVTSCFAQAVPKARAKEVPKAVVPAVPKAIPGPPTADSILEDVRRSRAVKDRDLAGTLTKGDVEVPFVVTLKAEYIRFTFKDPAQILHLEFKQKGSELREVTAGSNKPVAPSRYAEGIRGTDLSYDDIFMRYLYWQKKTLQPNLESWKTRKCYVIDLFAPAQVGEYGVVRIFTDKESGGLLRVMCYDWQGKMIKALSVTSGMKVDGATCLKSMDVIRYDPNTRKVTGETTFELQKP